MRNKPAHTLVILEFQLRLFFVKELPFARALLTVC